MSEDSPPASAVPLARGLPTAAAGRDYVERGSKRDRHGRRPCDAWMDRAELSARGPQRKGDVDSASVLIAISVMIAACGQRETLIYPASHIPRASGWGAARSDALMSRPVRGARKPQVEETQANACRRQSVGR